MIRKLIDYLTASYIIYIDTNDGENIKAVNGITGNVDFSNSDAATVIQSVINTLVRGGKIFIKGGYYILTKGLLIYNRFIWIEGELGATNIRDGGIGIDMITCDAQSQVNYSLVIKGLSFWPDQKDKTKYCIKVNNIWNVWLEDLQVGWQGIKITNVDHLWMDNIYLVDSRNEGLYMDTVNSFSVSNIDIDNCGGFGNVGDYDCMYLDTCGLGSFNNIRSFGSGGFDGGQRNAINLYCCNSLHFNNIDILYHENDGIKIDTCWDIQFSNLVVKECGKYGIEILSSSTNNTNGIYFNNFSVNNSNDNGVYIHAEGNNLWRIHFTNGQIINAGAAISQLGLSAQNKIGLLISDDNSGAYNATYVSVDNVDIADSYNGLIEEKYSNKNHVTNCKFSYITNIILSKVGKQTIIRHNIGYITENNVLSDAFTVDSTGLKTVTIAHGLDMTPEVQDCCLTVVQNSMIDDWEYNTLKIISVSDTNVIAKINVSKASTTIGTVAKLVLRVGNP